MSFGLRFWSSQRTVGAFEWHPTLGPAADLSECVLELATFQGELVFDSDRAFRDDGPNNETFCLQGTKTFGEHAIGDVGYRSLYGGVARSPLKERLQDGSGPPATDELDSAMKTRADLRNQWGCERI
jgi:hypothetical protein